MRQFLNYGFLSDLVKSGNINIKSIERLNELLYELQLTESENGIYTDSDYDKDQKDFENTLKIGISNYISKYKNIELSDKDKYEKIKELKNISNFLKKENKKLDIDINI
jgi:hypothetical protein